MAEVDAYDNQCGDGVDNDADGTVDWPADTLCSYFTDTTEANQCSKMPTVCGSRNSAP